MKVNIILEAEEKETINKTINILCAYYNKSNEGTERVKTLSLLNNLTDFLNEAIKTK